MSALPKTLGELATLLDVTLEGQPDTLITGVATIQTAQSGDLTFLANEKYAKYLPQTKAGAVLLAPDFVNRCHTNALVSDNPKLAFAHFLQVLGEQPAVPPGIDATAVIAQTAQIDPSATIAAHCVIGEHVKIGAGTYVGPGTVIERQCVIGQDCYLHPRVTLYHDVHLGSACRVHSGVVIGSDGFGFAQKESGGWEKVPQVGGVRIGDQVEIGANTTIDRGALSHTVIGHGVILDNLIQIAHNVVIGDYTAIAACTGVSGSTTIDRGCMIGGASSIGGHITVADGVMLAGGSAVASDVKKPGMYGSTVTLQPYTAWRRNLTRFHQLDDMAKRLKQLEKKLTQLDAQKS